jgi:hypothetical protein
MIQVRVPKQYSLPTGFNGANASNNLLWLGATGSPLMPQNSIRQPGAYTNEDALFPQIGAEFSYSGSDYDLSTLRPTTPDSSNYNDDYEDDSDFALFPCRKECKGKFDKKSPEFRICLTECKAKKGGKKALRGYQLGQDEKLNATLNQTSDPVQDAEVLEDDKGKKGKWAIIIILIVAILGVGAYMIFKKK